MNTFTVTKLETNYDRTQHRQQTVIRYSDDSFEYHNDLDPAVLLRVKQWCANQTPLVRSFCGAVIEASLSDAEQRAELDGFLNRLFRMRKEIAEEASGGSFDALADLEDRKQDPDDWFASIEKTRATVGEDLESFKASMLVVSHQAYAAHQWAQRKQDKEALIAAHESEAA